MRFTIPSRILVPLSFLMLVGAVSVQPLAAQPTPISITTTFLPNAVIGLPYLTATGNTVQLTAAGGNGGPYQWSYMFSTPTYGLSFNGDGTITGTPNALGTISFQVFASDPNVDEAAAGANLALTIVPCVATVAPPSPLPPGEINVPYPKVSFKASGCTAPYKYSAIQSPFTDNSLPPGMFLDNIGNLTGTPTVVGNYTFGLNVTDSLQSLTQVEYSLTVNALPTVTTTSPLPNGFVGVPYSQQIMATGGTPPYSFAIVAPPPGIVITPSGVLQGTPSKLGTYNFTVQVTDSANGEIAVPFAITFLSTVSQLLVSPLSLTFNADLNGSQPPTQAISIVPATGATLPANFHIVVDNGQSNTTQPTWINVSPTSGSAPASLVVSANQGNLTAGTYPGRIQVLDSNSLVTDVSLTLNVANNPQKLTVAPAMLNIEARFATPGNLIESLAVSNAGAGSLGFTTSVVGSSSWISSVTATSNTTANNQPVFIQVQVNTNGLATGSYHDTILVSSSAGNISVPVSLFVAASGPILGVNTTGVLFHAIQGGGSTATRTVRVLNLGAPSSTVNWAASLVSGSNWLNLVSSGGTATTTTPGTLTLALAPNATQLANGPYYAIVKLSDSKSLNSPQYITAVLNLEADTAAPGPDLDPPGLFFTASVGGSAPAAQQVQVNTSSAAAVAYDVATSTLDNGAWLTTTPGTGSASGQMAGSISVSVNPTGLPAGIYSGDVNVSIGSLLQSVNVTFVVQPTSSSSAASTSFGVFRPEAAGCTASSVAITETGLVNNFTVPAGWPATLIVQLNDDCAAPLTNGNVVASFSNGDAPLSLAGDSLGNYSATWQPSAVNPSMVVTLNATSGTLQPATAKLYGGIATNQTPPPTIAPGGTLNNLNPVVGGPLAPGTIAQVYGSGLASSTVSTGKLPLPTTFDETFALIGPTQAPLYFLSSGQINIQIPNEATATQQLPIVLSVNNALTLPLMLNIVPAAPGVLSQDDGPTPPSLQNGAHIIAQHSTDGSLVTSNSPAKPGEYLVMYLVGLGETNPSVASGAATPTSPLHPATVQPTVTVGSQTSTVLFAGLTPGFVGLYQIDFQVPTGATSGELVVAVSQNGVAANPTLLPVSN